MLIVNDSGGKSVPATILRTELNIELNSNFNDTTMVKIYLNSIVKQMRNHTATLDNSNILVDKPWALIDDENELQKLIFKKDQKLIMSKNGQVQIGKWEYFPEAKALLIDRNIDKILCNEAFIDNGVMILRLDGTDNRFFILANENVIPDLNVNEYLKNLLYRKLQIRERKLIDGKILEVAGVEEWDHPHIGNNVTVDAEEIEDGKYQLENEKKYFEIKQGKIIQILTETTYTNPDNIDIVIQQRDSNYISYGDCVFIDNKIANDQTINFSKRRKLVIQNGKVVRTESKNKIRRYFSNMFKKTVSDDFNE